MFDSILIKQNKISDSKVDLGLMCESLLFYGKTNFLLDIFTAKQFVQSVGLEKLKEYTERGIIKLYFRNGALAPAVFGSKLNSKQYSPFVVAQSEAFDLSEHVNGGFKELGFSEAETKLKTRDFLDLCNPLSYNKGFQDQLSSEWEDETLLTTQMRAYIKLYLPHLDLTNLKVEIKDKTFSPLGGNSYSFHSNYDLHELNSKYSEVIPQNTLLTWESFLIYLMESSGDIHLASNLNTEIYTDPLHLPFISNRIDELLNKIHKNQTQISSFQSIVLDDYRPIRDIINSGEKNFSDFEAVLDNSFDFRDWLEKVEEDTSIVKAYYEEISKESWLNKKPVKAARFGIFTGLGIVGDILAGGIPIGSAITSMSDNFLLPKLINGWKPNHFIDGNVKPFLNENPQ